MMVQQKIQFVEKLTSPDSSAFVKESEQIAVFDNDGTLWSEQPLYLKIRQWGKWGTGPVESPEK